MEIKYPENYLTIRWLRLSSSSIANEFASLSQISSVNTTVDANVESQLKLLEIEQHLTKAHEVYFQKKYQQAIDEYKLAECLIYQILDSSFPLAAARRPEVEFSVDKSLFNPLISSSLEFIEALAPRTIESNFGPAFVDVPKNVIEKLTRYSDLGVNPADGIPRIVHYDSQLASAYAERGQWERAEYFYKRAQSNLGAPLTPEAKSAKASLDLSLAGIYIQMGRTSEANILLGQASNVFKENKDIVGEAQVNLNMAAVLAKEGKHDEAATYLKKADQLIKKAQDLPEAGSSQGGLSGITRITPLMIKPNLSSLLTTRPDLTPVVERITTAISIARLGSIRPDALSDMPESKGLAVTYRQPGKGAGWTKQQVETKVEAGERAYMKELGILVGDNVLKVKWKSGSVVPAQQIINGIYQWRVDRKILGEVNWRYDLPSDFAVQLPHIYFYVIPVALGDCYHAIGEYEKAETYYLKAADYEYININIEVPNLWQKIADNILEWGNLLYRNDEYQNALDIYRKVLEPPGTATVVWGESPLYKHPKLKIVGDKVKTMLTNYDTSGVGNMNPALAAIVLEIRAKVLQLNAGLDFLGIPVDIVPIWSFDYLQNIARYFAQQAIHAEREFINFWDRAENEALTRQQLQQAEILGSAEQELAKKQREAAEAEKEVYDAGKDLATLRRQNAQRNRIDYSNMTAERIYYDAAIATLGAGSSVDWETIEEHIRRLQEERKTKGERGHLIGARTLERGRMTRDYELAAMDRQIDELQQGEVMAQAQLNAADARVDVAKQMEEVARLRKEAASQNLAAFNNQFFTPEVWYQMGSFMWGISKSYLYMAIQMARMMQRAYNFENDLNRHFIKADYSTNTVKGMLAGDALLLDIDSFTYDLTTTIKRKEIPVKQTISLAERYPFLFETQFRRNGKMEFETRIEDFDMAYPGTYGRRLESIEVEIEGMLPRSGVKGILTNGGISRYRTSNFNQIKFRIQPRETLVLSEYRIKEDAIVFPSDPRALKIFEGAGVAGSWTLEIPRSINDLDFNSITDVRLTFYYHARYDESLANDVKSQLNTLAGQNLRSRSIPLRWAYPDAFFHFQDTGQLAFLLDPIYFPFNEINPKIRNLSMLIITQPGINPTGWKVRLGVPAHPDTIVASTNSQGEIALTADHPWQPLAAGTVIGDYLVEMRAEENPNLVENNVLKLDDIRNIVLILEYEYTPRM